MKRVLLTGAGGFLGKVLTNELVKSGKYELCFISRSNKGEENNIIVDSFSSETNFKIRSGKFDVLIHLAGLAHISPKSKQYDEDLFAQVNYEGTVSLAKQASLSGVKRFIFISSIGVNGSCSEKAFTECDREAPYDAYSKSKYDAEIALRAISDKTGMEVVIIRPPLIYGAAAPGNFGALIKLLIKPIPLPFGLVDNKRSMIFIRNLVDFILLSMEHRDAANQVFLVSDGEDISLKALIESIRSETKTPILLFNVPLRVLNFLARWLGMADKMDKLTGDLQIDISKARNVLGWCPPYSVKEGMRLSVDDSNGAP